MDANVFVAFHFSEGEMEVLLVGNWQLNFHDRQKKRVEVYLMVDNESFGEKNASCGEEESKGRILFFLWLEKRTGVTRASIWWVFVL